MKFFNQGDIIEVNLDPAAGHELAMRRPVLVVSTDAFNMRSLIAFVSPITSIVSDYPLHVRIADNDADVRGCVCVEQTRAVDLSARPCRKLGELSVEDMNEVLNLLGAVFGI